LFVLSNFTNLTIPYFSKWVLHSFSFLIIFSSLPVKSNYNFWTLFSCSAILSYFSTLILFPSYIVLSNIFMASCKPVSSKKQTNPYTVSSVISVSNLNRFWYVGILHEYISPAILKSACKSLAVVVLGKFLTKTLFKFTFLVFLTCHSILIILPLISF